MNRDYNNLCAAIATEIRQGRAPAGAIPPERIDPKGVFKLDVDDAIWQDVGLDDENGSDEPPPWLSRETVRSGIKALLELDRADEEDGQLVKECRSLRRWFSEEWTLINRAMDSAGRFRRPNAL